MNSKNSVTLYNTHQHIIKSKNVNDDFRIDIYLPQSYSETNKGYPVLFLMDTNIYFAIVSAAARIMHFGNEIDEMIIVGVGYPDDGKHLHLRNRDYCPTKYNMPKIAGKADAFINFIKHELMPFIKDNYRADLNDASLAGDSLSGLFAIYVLLTQPDLFCKYIAGSPSLYWDDDLIFDIEQKYAHFHNDLKAAVFMSAGELEAIQEPEFAGMVRNVIKMDEMLTSRNYKSLKLTTHVFSDESHLSVIPATFSRGLKTIYGTDKDT